MGATYSHAERRWVECPRCGGDGWVSPGQARIKQDNPQCFACGGPHDLDDCPTLGDVDDEYELLCLGTAVHGPSDI
ncbi:MAG: hypothetical protein ABI566_12445 [Pseudolysinimonas sp.]